MSAVYQGAFAEEALFKPKRLARLPFEAFHKQVQLCHLDGLPVEVHAVNVVEQDALPLGDRQRPPAGEAGADDVYEVFEMRKYLEGPAAELAAGRMDRRHCAPLRAAADALAALPQTAPEWTAAWADFDELFHQTIADASGNRRLAADIGRYRMLHKGINRLTTDAESLQAAMAEHLGILDAIEARDGRLARQRMVGHIGAWQDFFLRRVFRPAAETVGRRSSS